MLLIPCPFCGAREHDEFSFGGEISGRRPALPAAMDDDAWTSHLFTTWNSMGPGRYFVCHVAGCGQWFAVTLDTLTHEFRDPEVARVPAGGLA